MGYKQLPQVLQQTNTVNNSVNISDLQDALATDVSTQTRFPTYAQVSLDIYLITAVHESVKLSLMYIHGHA